MWMDYLDMDNEFPEIEEQYLDFEGDNFVGESTLGAEYEGADNSIGNNLFDNNNDFSYQLEENQGTNSLGQVNFGSLHINNGPSGGILPDGTFNPEAVTHVSKDHFKSWIDKTTNPSDYFLRDNWGKNAPNQLLDINKGMRYEPPTLIPMETDDSIDDERSIDEGIKETIENTPEWENLSYADRFDLMAEKISSLMEKSGIKHILKNPAVRSSFLHMLKYIHK